jgi:hypothetical protein
LALVRTAGGLIDVVKVGLGGRREVVRVTVGILKTFDVCLVEAMAVDGVADAIVTAGTDILLGNFSNVLKIYNGHYLFNVVMWVGSLLIHFWILLFFCTFCLPLTNYHELHDPFILIRIYIINI